MGKVMINLTLDGPPPTVDMLRQQFGLLPGQIDDDFGVIEVDPENHIFTIFVDEHASSVILGDQQIHAEGPFSNPRIAPFGLPQDE